MLQALIVLACLTGTPRTQMPNFSQSDFELPNGGTRYGCPVAAADAVFWLSENGFKDLIRAKPTKHQEIRTLILEIARYVKTTPEGNGTEWDNVISGLPAFLLGCGYAKSSVFYYGAAPIKNSAVVSGNLVPNLEQLKKGNTPGGFVLLVIGCYQNADANGNCRKVDQHWGTLIDTDPNLASITFNDPSGNADGQRKPVTSRTYLITEGQPLNLLDPVQKTRTVSGVGHMVLRNYPYLGRDQFAVIEAAIYVRLAR